MKKEISRLKSFLMDPHWPVSFIDITSLARAGFFYTLREDYVQCAFCCGIVGQWQRGDDPMMEHRRLFGNCHFIMGYNVGNEPIKEDPFPGPKRPIPYDVCGIYNDTIGEYSASSGNVQDQEQVTSREVYQLIKNSIETNPSPWSRECVCLLRIILYLIQSYNQNPSTICKICYEKPIQTCIIPCGHSVCCVGCLEEVNLCPCCRSPIIYRYRTYIV